MPPFFGFLLRLAFARVANNAVTQAAVRHEEVLARRLLDVPRVAALREANHEATTGNIDANNSTSQAFDLALGCSLGLR